MTNMNKTNRTIEIISTKLSLDRQVNLQLSDRFCLYVNSILPKDKEGANVDK